MFDFRRGAGIVELVILTHLLNCAGWRFNAVMYPLCRPPTFLTLAFPPTSLVNPPTFLTQTISPNPLCHPPTILTLAFPPKGGKKRYSLFYERQSGTFYFGGN